MRTGSGIVAVGAALLVAAVAGLIIAWEHRIATRTQVEFAQNGQRAARCSVGDVHCAKVEEVVRSVRPGYVGVMIASGAIVIVVVVLVPIGLIWVRVANCVARIMPGLLTTGQNHRTRRMLPLWLVLPRALGTNNRDHYRDRTMNATLDIKFRAAGHDIWIVMADGRSAGLS